MARFCTNCGSELNEASKFCTKCGAPAGAGQQPPAAPPPQYQAPPPPPPPNYQQPQYPAAASSGLQSNVAGLLCYLAGIITGIIFLVIEPYNKDRFIRFHAFQSIFFSVAWIILMIIENVIAMALPWSLSFLVHLLYLVISVGGFLLWLFLMYKAYNNEMFKLPVVGDIAMKQAG